MKIKSNIEKVCPFCNKKGVLDYDFVNNEEDNMCYYRWHCENCGHNGEEWYHLEFIGHQVYDKKGDCVEIQDNMIGKEV